MGDYIRRAELNAPGSVTVDSAGNLVIADSGNVRIQVVADSTGTFYGQAMTNGDIYTVADTAGYSGDGSPATSAELNTPTGAAVDSAGNLVIADSNNGRVQVVAASNGTFYGQAMTADDIYSIASGLGLAFGVAADGSGNALAAGSNGLQIGVVAASNGHLLRAGHDRRKLLHRGR